MSLLGDSYKSVEEIRPFPRQHALVDRVHTIISTSKDKAKKLHQELEADVRIYADGSVTREGVGAAAVMTNNSGQQIALQLHLGLRNEHTVYEAELIGITLAARLLDRNIRGKAVIFVDNKSATSTSFNHVQHGPAQNLIVKLQQELSRTLSCRNNLSVTVAWIPGHAGIEGNEKVDTLAKEAAAGTSSPKTHLP